jgi:hypothetical protein
MQFPMATVKKMHCRLFSFNFALGRNRTRVPRVPEPKRTPLGYILSSVTAHGTCADTFSAYIKEKKYCPLFLDVGAFSVHRQQA